MENSDAISRLHNTDRITVYSYCDGIEGTVVGEAGVTGKAESDGLKGSNKRLAGFVSSVGLAD